MRLAVAGLAVASSILAIGCASGQKSYPKPDNPNYVGVKGLWYCVGNVVFPWGPGGATWVDDRCQPHMCADMKFPPDECIGIGRAIE